MQATLAWLWIRILPPYIPTGCYAAAGSAFRSPWVRTVITKVCLRRCTGPNINFGACSVRHGHRSNLSTCNGISPGQLSHPPPPARCAWPLLCLTSKVTTAAAFSQPPTHRSLNGGSQETAKCDPWGTALAAHLNTLPCCAGPSVIGSGCWTRDASWGSAPHESRRFFCRSKGVSERASQSGRHRASEGVKFAQSASPPIHLLTRSVSQSVGRGAGRWSVYRVVQQRWALMHMPQGEVEQRFARAGGGGRLSPQKEGGGGLEGAQTSEPSYPTPPFRAMPSRGMGLHAGDTCTSQATSAAHRPDHGSQPGGGGGNPALHATACHALPCTVFPATPSPLCHATACPMPHRLQPCSTVLDCAPPCHDLPCHALPCHARLQACYLAH